MKSKYLLVALVASLASAPLVASAQAVSKERLEKTKKLVSDAVDRLGKTKAGLVGYSVIIAAEGQPDFFKTFGVANAKTGAPVTPSTAFYVASMTKPYTGLLAARFDREGILPVSTPLSAIWPGLKLPAPLDASTLTFDQLLSHQTGFENAPLEQRSAYTDEVPISAYPRILEEGSKPTGTKFHYTNLGYLIYSAALKLRTGRDWKAHQEELIFRPFGLTQTYTRSSLVPAADLAWGHRWSGTEWLVVPPKDDAVMHAAGGSFISSRDVARWIRIQLAEGKGAKGFVPADFDFARKKLADQNENQFGIACDGYALGWHLCSFKSQRLFYHGGTYDGVRTHQIVLPGLRAGIAVMANSDSLTHSLGYEMMATAIASLMGDDGDATKRAGTMVGAFPERIRKSMEGRVARAAASEADPAWGGWTWAPTVDALKLYEGIYHSDLWGDVEVRREDGALVAWRGAMRRVLRPAKSLLFATRLDAIAPYEAVTFTSGTRGIETVAIGGARFSRLPPSSSQ